MRWTEAIGQHPDGPGREATAVLREGLTSAATILSPTAPSLPSAPERPTILELMEAAEWFGRWFQGGTWEGWKAFLAAVFGLPMDAEAAAIYRQHTGRETAPTQPTREGWVVAGVRAGKSRIAALIAVFLACFRDYTPYLAPGERAVVMVLAGDRKQAGVIFGYVRAFLAIPALQQVVLGETREAIRLKRRVVIEIHASSFRSVRGYTCAAVICDEIAFWPTDEGGANPDVEILKALRPRMVTIPGALLLCISSPYARRGALWDAYRQHYGKDGDPVLVWQADTRSMNPTVPAELIADAYEADEAAAAAEYGAEFRRDIESFISREAVEAVVIPDRHELPPAPDVHYHAFVDPSGGAADSMTLAIAHQHGDHGVLDCIRERKAPFSPAEVIAEFAAALKLYRVSMVTGDRYAGEWPRERFREHGIEYQVAEQTRSDLYRDLLPLLTSQRVELLDNRRLVNQLCSLERRPARSGRDSIDHAPGAHDDLINAVAGVLARRDSPVMGVEAYARAVGLLPGAPNAEEAALPPDLPEILARRLSKPAPPTGLMQTYLQARAKYLVQP
jgi:hypothetical protein